MVRDEASDKFGMAVSSLQAKYSKLILDDKEEMVHTRRGLIPASVEVKVVRCPFETLIQLSEKDMPLCKHARDCNLKGSLDLCQVPHLHNFEAPGPRMQFESRTITEKFSLKAALQRVERKTRTVRRMKKEGKKIIKPKEIKRVLDTSLRKVKEKTSTRVEAYSVYEFDTTPPAVPKTEIIMTRAEKWDAKDQKETKRLTFIQDCRDFKIQQMLATC